MEIFVFFSRSDATDFLASKPMLLTRLYPELPLLLRQMYQSNGTMGPRQLPREQLIIMKDGY
jgi:hypothetical protein